MMQKIILILVFLSLGLFLVFFSYKEYKENKDFWSRAERTFGEIINVKKIPSSNNEYTYRPIIEFEANGKKFNFLDRNNTVDEEIYNLFKKRSGTSFSVNDVVIYDSRYDNPLEKAKNELKRELLTKNIIVYYDPLNPKESTTKNELKTYLGIIIMFILGIIFTLVSIFVLPTSKISKK